MPLETILNMKPSTMRIEALFTPAVTYLLRSIFKRASLVGSVCEAPTSIYTIGVTSKVVLCYIILRIEVVGDRSSSRDSRTGEDVAA